MDASKPSLLKHNGVNYFVPFILITACFSLWGFANDITNPMVKAFFKIFRMSVTEGALVQLAFYGGYFAMAFPVPFIVHWPGKVRTGISDALVSQIDMLGTMASLTGISEVNSIPEDSQDQLPAWLGIDPDGRDYVIGAASSLTILTRDWKYIEPSNGRPYNRLTNTELGNKQADQLYDMRSDRGEYDNVAEKNKLMVRFLKQLLEEEKSKGTGLDL